MRSLTLLLALSAPYTALAARLLALHDPTSPSTSSGGFGGYFASLRDQGHDLDVATYEDGGRLLETRSADYYEGLIVFGSAAKQVPRSLTPQALARRIDQYGTSLVLAVPPDAAELWRDFAREFEVDFDDRGQVVVDYFSPPSPSSAPSDGTLFSVLLSSAPSPFVDDEARAAPPVLYRGAGHLASRHPQLTPVLRAGSGAFSTDGGEGAAPPAPEEVRLAGSNVGLVSAFQARNNARVVFSGSADLFSEGLAVDADGNPTGNPAFLRSLSRWAFQQSGQLRVVSSAHENVETGVEGGSTYRVGSELKYTLTLASTSPTPLADIQLEFTMLDPHVRLALTPISSSPSSSSPGLTETTYEATFRVPDRHGVFTLLVDYRRAGVQNVQDRHTISVVPLRHNEYERFITGAAPFYAGAVSVSVGFALFVVVWVLGAGSA
ncbi:hypothetical protein JCM10213_006762 [Rhodosporidiobolus nylandii]